VTRNASDPAGQAPQKRNRRRADPRLMLRLANVLQSALTQYISIALVGFRKLDDLVCYRLPNIIVAVSDPQRDASLLEGETQHAQRFLIEPFTV
jgi:hypothetical protein